MSTQKLQLLYDNNTSAGNFTSWGSAISAVLDVMWPKTADTGQVAWGSTPSVPTVNTFVYEIRTPASDPLQTGGTAYYLKVEYGSVGVQSAPAIRFSIGTGTNGAGTLTGPVVGPTPTALNSAGLAGQGSSLLFECTFSYTASRFVMCLWRNNTATSNSHTVDWVMGLERTKDATGADSSDGVTLVGTCQGNTVSLKLQQTMAFGLSGTTAHGQFLTVGDGSLTTNQWNNNIPIGPIFPEYGKFGNAMTIFATARSGDVTEGALLSTTLFGSSVTYLCLVRAGATVGPNSAANSALLMRYD